MWLFNVFNQGCCCTTDDAEFDRFAVSDERPVSYSSHWEPGPDPLVPAKAIVASPTLRGLKAFYHLSDVGTGVKTGQFDYTANFIAKYYKAINAASELGWDKFMSLWADERAGLHFEAFAGSSPLRSKAEIRAFVESFPAMSVETTSVKVAQDEFQGASSCVFVLQEPPAGVPSRINCVATFRLNPYGKLAHLRLFWHPSELGGASKTSQYEITARRIRAFIDALNNDDAASWAEQSGKVTLEDPVGTLPRGIEQVVQTYRLGLPPFTATLKMVRMGQDELQAAAVINMTFPDNHLLSPYSIIFTFQFE